MFRAILAASALAAIAVAPAHAAGTFYVGKSAFIDATGPLNFESFEAPSYVAPTFAIFADVIPVTASGGGGTGLLDFGINATDGVKTVGVTSPDSITFNFTHPIQAFGIDAIGLGTVYIADLVISYAGGSATLYSNVGQPLSSLAVFAGLVDPAGFTSVTLRGTAAARRVP